MLNLCAPRSLTDVLLIDDGLVGREVIAALLAMSGYAIYIAAAGSLVVCAFRRASLRSLRYNVYRSDIVGIQT
jgi:hypothetical protein